MPRNRKNDNASQAASVNASSKTRGRKKSKDDSGQMPMDSYLSPSTLSRDNAQDHYQEKRKSRSRHKAVKVVLIVLLVSLLGVGGAAWAYLNNIQSRLNSGIDDSLKSSLTTSESGSPFYMLLIGIDKNEDRVESAEYGASDSAYRTDSIMLTRIDPKNKKVTLVSIHRDTLVDLGTYNGVNEGKQKINAAYSVGGAAFTVQTISKFAGVNISHYAEVDFDSFCAIVDQLGGIDVYVPVDCYDPEYTGADIKAGWQTLDSNEALQLCRARHAYDNYGDGDLYRAANQRMVISAIIKKIMTEDVATMTQTISTAANSVTTDMSLTDILALANDMRGIDVDNDVYSGMEPTNSEYVNKTWYEICDTTAWQKMMKRVDEGLSPYEDASDDPTQGIAGSTDTISNGDSSSSDSSSSSSTTSDTTTASTSGTIEVLNGTATAGLAGRVAKSLESLGYNATSGNANSKAYSTTVIVYNGSENQAEAQAVADALGGEISVEANDGTYDSSANVVVILGTDMSSK